NNDSGFDTSELKGIIMKRNVQTSSQISIPYENHSPIVIRGNADFINQSTTENWSGDGTPSSPIIIDGLNITGFSDDYLIDIRNVDVHFRISHCLLNRGWFGINFFNATNGQLLHNIVSNNNGNGIHLYFSGNSTLNNNTIINNSKGIYLLYSGNSIISDNVFVNNGQDGIHLSHSGNSTISGNTADGNHWSGIYQIESVNNNLTGNIFTNNGYDGIYICYSKNSALSGNTVTNNSNDGIGLSQSENSILSCNTVTDNDNYGIKLDYTVNTSLFCNIVANNSDYGIHSHLSENNRVRFNSISENNAGRVQAYDNGFYNEYIYNYWSDWLSPDMNEDGIVDNPYIIDGSANNIDNYPFIFLNLTQSHFVFGPTISSPTGGLTLKGNVRIVWTAGVDSWGHSVTYTVSCSADTGATWIIIASSLTATSYLWDSTTVDNANYLIRVNASCAEGIWNADTSDGFITIDNPAPTITTSATTADTVTDGIPVSLLGGLLILALIAAVLILRKESG
ncbi:MAG: nitrous oxide reductase family maturation protein NosD, partial [Candidatus Hodarchaeota archaeon]